MAFVFRVLMLMFFLGTLTRVFAQDTISDYQRTWIPGFDESGHIIIAIRTYQQNNKHYFLVVDPEHLTTSLQAADTFRARQKNASFQKPGYFILKDIDQTPYVKALKRATSVSNSVATNRGLSAADHPVHGMFLTVDMCPSAKYFEKDFFEYLIQLAKKKKHPTEVGIAITGLWALAHPKEFDRLLEAIHSDLLSVTWINHSFSHVYYQDVSFSHNFLLTPHTNIEHEILGVEKILLEHGQLPSVFFRFPGLVSDGALMRTLRDFGLIPVGSHAWLAKNQHAKEGSIVLVHGNSNEHEGIEKAMFLLQTTSLPLLPLRQAIR